MELRRGADLSGVFTLRVYVGLDVRQPIAANVAAFSIERRASKPVSVTKLIIDQLPIKRMGLTQFSLTRYLAPFLSGYEGASVFVDADVLCLCDIYEMVEAANLTKPVSVVVNKNPKLAYERPSVMVFNNELCKSLTPEYIETGNPQTLEWAGSYGELPAHFNHLVGYDDPNPEAKLIHFTQGIPCFPETKDSEFAAEWIAEHRLMNGTVSWSEIMASSVHAKPVLERLRKQS